MASDRTIIDRSSHKKLHHKQQKIFPLPEAYKACLMFNNNIQINGVPWDIVIHQYNAHLNKSKPKLSDTEAILAHFITFLIQQNDLFPMVEQNRYAAYDLLAYFKAYQERRYFDWQEKGITAPFHDYLAQSLFSFFLDKDYQAQPTDTTVPQYKEVISSISNAQLAEILGMQSISSSLRSVLDHIMQYLLFQGSLIHEKSEIIIAGYGMETIFPAVSTAVIGGAYCNQLHHHIQPSQKISHNNQAQIIPFAHSHYINETLKGLSGENEDFILNLFYDQLTHMNIQGSPISEHSKSHYFEDFRLKLSQHLRDQHISPMIQTIKHMPEEDMAEIACTFLRISQFKQNLAELSFSTASAIDYITINHQNGATLHCETAAKVHKDETANITQY